MKFIKVEGTVELEEALVASLKTALTKKTKVLWLVPGGSNIAVAVRVMANLPDVILEYLTIILTDERFGEPSHQYSNYRQLIQAGFDTRGATFVDLLDGKTFEETVSKANDAMAKDFTKVELIVGFFGMGQDGHIAGILPHSPATAKEETWMIGYDAGQYKRITLTPFAISHIQLAYVGAFGAEKLDALKNLCNKMLPMTEQPAQILCHVPEVYIFNDQLGDKT